MSFIIINWRAVGYQGGRLGVSLIYCAITAVLMSFLGIGDFLVGLGAGAMGMSVWRDGA